MGISYENAEIGVKGGDVEHVSYKKVHEFKTIRLKRGCQLCLHLSHYLFPLDVLW